MPRDYVMFAELCARFTPSDQARLRALEQANHLKVCPVVEALRGVPREPEWFDVSPYQHDKRRFSATFLKPFGNQMVGGGGEARPDGVMRAWAYVAGEFETKDQGELT